MKPDGALSLYGGVFALAPDTNLAEGRAQIPNSCLEPLHTGSKATQLLMTSEKTPQSGRRLPKW